MNIIPGICKNRLAGLQGHRNGPPGGRGEEVEEGGSGAQGLSHPHHSSRSTRGSAILVNKILILLGLVIYV